jgi:hypothetical protein
VRDPGRPEREVAAKRLGVRVNPLDEPVKARRAQAAADSFGENRVEAVISEAFDGYWVEAT